VVESTWSCRESLGLSPIYANCVLINCFIIFNNMVDYDK